MSGFTIVNLKEIEDSASGRSTGVQAHVGRKHLGSEHLGVSYLRYEPGYHGSNGHSHKQQEEAYIVVGGSGRVKLGDQIVELKEWDVVRVAPETIRAFESGPDGLELIAVGSDRPEEGDGVLAPDWWLV